MSKEKPFVVPSDSEGRRTSPDKKRELPKEKEGLRFCSVSISLDRWMSKHLVTLSGWKENCGHSFIVGREEMSSAWELRQSEI